MALAVGSGYPVALYFVPGTPGFPGEGPAKRAGLCFIPVPDRVGPRGPGEVSEKGRAIVELKDATPKDMCRELSNRRVGFIMVFSNEDGSEVGIARSRHTRGTEYWDKLTSLIRDSVTEQTAPTSDRSDPRR